MESPGGNKQRLAILGSTGSIGTQALEIVRRMPDSFAVEMLAARDNWELLAAQAVEFEPDCVVIAHEKYYGCLSDALAHLPIKVYTGEEAAAQSVRSSEIDTVISAMVGFAGLLPTLEAVRAGKKVALANKESLVVAGELVMKEALLNNAPILPVDSEHSAIFQCLVGEVSPLKKVILTASGGAFRDVPVEELPNMTAAQALRHPNWNMGDKITIDCATMMNKGFEVIEAKWLFGLEPGQIEVALHPQSIVHSFVEFQDGAVKAQLGVPDMCVPIQYALTFPHRAPVTGDDAFDLFKNGRLDFYEPDPNKYPCLRLAFDALSAGGGVPCVMNAANEVAVAEFLAGNIAFTDIYRWVSRTIEKVDGGRPVSWEEYKVVDETTRRTIRELMGRRVND